MREQDRLILIESGEKVIQETRRWDDNKEYSYPMRSKEDAKDYRYFPEPDLVPIVISDEWLKRIKDSQPEFREEKMARYIKEYGIPEYDAGIITATKKLADIFEETVSEGANAKKVSNYLMGETMRLLKEHEMDAEEISFSPVNLAKLIKLIDAGTINSSVAKEVFEKVFIEDIDPDVYIEEHGLKMDNDEEGLRKMLEEIVANNPQSVEDYHNGKDKAIGFLVGQVMKASRGQANPKRTNELIQEELKKR